MAIFNCYVSSPEGNAVTKTIHVEIHVEIHVDQIKALFSHLTSELPNRVMPKALLFKRCYFEGLRSDFRHILEVEPKKNRSEFIDLQLDSARLEQVGELST